MQARILPALAARGLLPLASARAAASTAAAAAGLSLHHGLHTSTAATTARAGGPSEPPIVDDQQPSRGGAAPTSSSSSAGGRSFQGTPLDSSEGPSPHTSPEDEQKTGGVGQQGSPASYRLPHATGGEGREFEEVNK